MPSEVKSVREIVTDPSSNQISFYPEPEEEKIFETPREIPCTFDIRAPTRVVWWGRGGGTSIFFDEKPVTCVVEEKPAEWHVVCPAEKT
jgi:hypothetical protein